MASHPPPSSRSRQGSEAVSRSRQGSSIDDVVKTRPRGESYDTVGLLRNDSRPLPQERDLASLGSLTTLEASLDSLLTSSEGAMAPLQGGQQLFGEGEGLPLAEFRGERSASWDGAPYEGRVARSGSLESCCSSSSGWSSSSDAEAGARIDAGSSLARPKSKVAWTPEEDHLIAEGVRRFGNKWSRIVETLPTAAARTDDAVRNRWQRLQRKQKRQEAKAGRGARTFSDDGIGEERLAPSKHGDMWTQEEDMTIDEGVKLHGFKWRAIAAVLPGRTESGCRNRWIRNQERALAVRGIQVHGAQEVIAALHKSGELRQNGSAYLPAAGHGAAFGMLGNGYADESPRDAMDDEPLFPPPPDEPLFPAAEPMTSEPLSALAADGHAAAHLAPPGSVAPAAAYPWETCAAIQALRRDTSASLGAQPEMILQGVTRP